MHPWLGFWNAQSRDMEEKDVIHLQMDLELHLRAAMFCAAACELSISEHLQGASLG